MAKDQAFYEFMKGAEEIANLLESDCLMNEKEQLLLEKHLLLLGMAYVGWKLRNPANLQSDIRRASVKDNLLTGE
jgi:hypothetical protein